MDWVHTDAKRHSGGFDLNKLQKELARYTSTPTKDGNLRDTLNRLNRIVSKQKKTMKKNSDNILRLNFVVCILIVGYICWFQNMDTFPVAFIIFEAIFLIFQNFMLIYAVAKIRAIIKGIKNVLPNERLIFIHFLNFIISTIL